MPPAFTLPLPSLADTRADRCARHGSRGWLTALILALCLSALAQDLSTLPGKVTRVLDGDTADVQLGSGPIRIRLNGIDAPEKNQPFGPEASQALIAMIGDHDVQIEPFKQDKYDRLTANVFLDDCNINAEMVRLGFAWAYRKFMKRGNPALCAIEDEARTARRGLWSQRKKDWIAPWDWRHLQTRANHSDFSKETAADCVAAIGK